MAAPKLTPAKCPTCGANLPVPPGVFQITCRYCQNVIQVERRKPPAHVQPFGAPGAMPSRTLYVDPEAAASAGRRIGLIILIATLVPVLIPLFIFIGPRAVSSIKGKVKPFPIACGINETVEATGNFETTGPIVTSAAVNCKLHIKDAKLKGSSLIKDAPSNLQITLENVTIETTGPMLRGDNLKVKVIGSTLTSAKEVFDAGSNMKLEVDGSTIESKNDVGVKAKYNLKLEMNNAKIRGKDGGIDADANVVLSMKNASEITSSAGVALKTSSSLKLDAEGGKIDGAGGAIVVSSGAKIEGDGLVISSKAKAIEASSSLDLDLDKGSITSLGDTAIVATSSLKLTAAGVTVQGATTAISCDSNAKIKASKKTRIIGATDNGVTSSSNTEVELADASIEAGGVAFKGTSNTKIKLGAGARIVGKKGGVEAETNFRIDATGASLEGGAGPALTAKHNARISFKSGTLAGNPAIHLERRPMSLDLAGTKIVGAQRIPSR